MKFSLLQRLVSCFSPRVLSLAIATVAAAPLPGVAGTVPVLPAPIYSISLFHNAADCLEAVAPGTYGCGGVTATVAGFPTALVSVTENDSAGNSNSATVSLTYHYAVVGPVDFVTVPMLVNFSLGASATHPPAGDSTNASESLFVIAQPGFSPLVVKQAESGGSSGCVACIGTFFSGTVAFNEPSGVDEQVFMRVLAAGRPSSCSIFPCTGSESGFVDPFISIDPAFLLTHPGYSVIVSRGIGNASPAVGAVPEPETYALMLAGLGMLGFIRRRRKQNMD